MNTEWRPIEDPPQEGALIRFRYRFPYSGNKEFTGVYRADPGRVMTRNGRVKLVRWLPQERPEIGLLGWVPVE